MLQHTTPHQNSAVDDMPQRVQLDFNEPVRAGFGSLRVYDSDGERVDTAEVSYPLPGRKSVAIGLREGLGEGIYTTTYRVVSADGHPVVGGFAFGVGVQVTEQRDAPDVAELLARSSAGPLVEGVYGAARGLHYAALLLLVGAIIFRAIAAPPGSGGRWPAKLLIAAAAIGLVSALVAYVGQAALGAGVGFGGAFDGRVLQEAMDTRTGAAWMWRAVLWAFTAVFLVLYRDVATRWEIAGLALPIAAIVATLPIAGHADTQSPRAVLIPSDVIHVLAGGAWLGGLVLLLVMFWPRKGEVEEGATAATGRFSRYALASIILLVIAGVAQSWFYLGSLGELFSGVYGLALSAKILLLGGIVALAAANRRRLARIAEGSGAADRARALVRAMRGEVAIAVLVLAATATLVRAAPPVTVNSGPVIRELDLGPMRLQMDIEPGDAGPTDYHLYLFDRRTGAQIDRVEQLTVQLVHPEKDIGPITLDIPRKGPAHYELLNSPIGVSGDWVATVTVRVSEFDEYSAKTEFEIRG